MSMGSHRYSDRTFVEDCTCVDISDFRRNGMFSESTPKGPLVLDRLVVGPKNWTLQASVKRDSQGSSQIELSWEVNGYDGKGWEIPLGIIQVEHLKNPLSGVHRFLICPSPSCSRRVRKLFLPPGQEEFKCRRCHNLRYRSTNENYSNLLDEVLQKGQMTQQLKRGVEVMKQHKFNPLSGSKVISQ